MSGIALVFRRDGAPVAPTELETMTAAMAHRAVDGVRHEIDGPVGVGFCSMVTTPAPHGDPQPFRCRGGSTIVAFDGRIDDRRALVARLGGRASTESSDSELLAHAVERWGAGFVNRLIGDFAIVVADLAQRRVICARDHLGVRPLYYANVGPVLVAASEVKAVLAHPAVPDELDPDSFEVWAEHWVVPEGTIYRNIAPLPMGSTLVATPNGTAGPTRYWAPSCTPDGASTPAALVEEYRELATEAIRDRLRADGPVVVAMSGGLDSTAVASTALALGRQEPALPEVRLASLVFPGHRRADESRLIAMMERSLGCASRRVRPLPRTPADLAAEMAFHRELPDVPNDMLDALARPELGERVVLTGLGGDDWFYARRGLDLTRALRHGRLLKTIKAARAAKAAGTSTSARSALWRLGLRPLGKVPGALLGRSPIASRAVEAVGGRFGTGLLEVSWCPRGVPLDTAPLLASARHPLLAARLAVIERRAAYRGIEHRHPLHDVRLIELSLRMPGSLRTVGGDPRWLPRRAHEGHLPDEVRLRRDKAEFSLIVREELELASAHGLVHEPTPAKGHPRRGQLEWRQIQATDADTSHPELTVLWSQVVRGIWAREVYSQGV